MYKEVAQNSKSEESITILRSEWGIPSTMYVRTPPLYALFVNLCLYEATVYHGILGILLISVSKMFLVGILLEG